MRCCLTALLALVAACSFSGSSKPGLVDGGGDGDGDGDGDIDAGDQDAGVDATTYSCELWGERRFFDACAEPLLETPVTAPDLSTQGTYVIDTDDLEITDPDENTSPLGSAETLTDAFGNQTEAHLVFVSSLTVPANVTLRAVGSRPLVLASAGSIQIDGAVDVGSRFDEDGNPQIGAGAGAIDDGLCTDAATLDGANDIDGGSGAGGGALGAAGGSGGDSAQGGTTGASGGDTLDVVEMPLRGGCPGGQGGRGQGGSAGGLGGPGGGAVLLSAVGQVLVNGSIQAGGAGGRGQITAGRNGGGGGGSGGLIALEGVRVTIGSGASLAGNGGGGGGGADESTDPDLHGASGALGTTRAAGGDGDDNGNGDTTGDGGAGGAGTVTGTFPGLPGQDDELGGGGGGGSVGAIVLLSTMVGINGTLSPLARLDQPPYD